MPIAFPPLDLVNSSPRGSLWSSTVITVSHSAPLLHPPHYTGVLSFHATPWCSWLLLTADWVLLPAASAQCPTSSLFSLTCLAWMISHFPKLSEKWCCCSFLISGLFSSICYVFTPEGLPHCWLQGMLQIFKMKFRWFDDCDSSWLFGVKI